MCFLRVLRITPTHQIKEIMKPKDKISITIKAENEGGYIKVSDQVKDYVQPKMTQAKQPLTVISTGSTLLDLAISGGVIHGGGLPGGILVEIFGPASTGKTTLLCEIASRVQKLGGDVKFFDPEGRLNETYTALFGLVLKKKNYKRPDTIPELFKPIREWEPEPSEGVIHGAFADSLAALSTEIEMDDRDKMGMRRAKEFSEECRKTCRILALKGFLMVCSNQIRQTGDMYGPKTKSPGGEAIGFYSSVRLKVSSSKKVEITKKIYDKSVTKPIGIQTTIEVFKNSVWEPYNSAPVYIVFNYGIDDIRANLIYLKQTFGLKEYVVLGETEEQNIILGDGIEKAIRKVEDENLVEQLKQGVIKLWMEIHDKLTVVRTRQ